MKAIKCLLVDDEPLASQVIEAYIKRVDKLQAVGVARSAEKALQVLHNEPVDLLFLDIQMPRMDGIIFLKSLVNPPAVIFITAYKEYAIDGYDLNIVDYLLKPVSFERFLKAVNKFIALRQAARISVADEPETTGQFIFFKGNKRRILKVMLDDIIYIESLSNYIRVKTVNQQIIAYDSINNLEQTLPVQKFIRIHRSYIVAVSKILSFSATDVEMDKETLPVGRLYKKDFLRRLNYNG